MKGSSVAEGSSSNSSSPMGRLLLQAGEAKSEGGVFLVRVNGWDTPTFCVDVAKVVAQRHPSLTIVMLDRTGRAVAGYVPNGVEKALTHGG